MYAVIFENQRTENHSQEYSLIAEKMETLVKTMPGFLSYTSVRNEQGLGVTVSYFKDKDSINNWKSNSKHLLAQTLGKKKVYSRYSIKICKVESENEWIFRGQRDGSHEPIPKIDRQGFRGYRDRRNWLMLFQSCDLFNYTRFHS